jgi:hypothetical protein
MGVWLRDSSLGDVDQQSGNFALKPDEVRIQAIGKVQGIIPDSEREPALAP